MVVDTSVLVAILLKEPDRARLYDTIEAAERRLLSAASYLEAVLVLTDKVELARVSLDGLLARLDLEICPIAAEHAQMAADAFERFGKGRGGRAQLNFGDCMVYALAKATGEPLLFKGDDFTHTDVMRVT